MCVYYTYLRGSEHKHARSMDEQQSHVSGASPGPSTAFQNSIFAKQLIKLPNETAQARAAISTASAMTNGLGLQI